MHAANMLLTDGTVIRCTPRLTIAEAQNDMHRLEAAFKADCEHHGYSDLSDEEGLKLLRRDAQEWSDYVDLCKSVSSNEHTPQAQIGLWVEAVVRAVRQLVKLEWVLSRASATA